MSKSFIPHLTDPASVHSVASFLIKTFEILEKDEYSNIISWTNQGDCFSIKNILQFTNEILPKYFRHRNFSSFVRQLNMYDFHKIKQTNNLIVFKNVLFRRGQSQLLRNIKRKAPKKTQHEKKDSPNKKNQHLEEEVHVKHTFQNGVQASFNLFEKSINIMETLHSLMGSKINHQNITSLQYISEDSTNFYLQKLDSIKKKAAQSFRCLESLNSVINLSLQQKISKYNQLNHLESLKNHSVSEGLIKSVAKIEEDKKSLESLDYQRKVCFQQ